MCKSTEEREKKTEKKKNECNTSAKKKTAKDARAVPSTEQRQLDSRFKSYTRPQTRRQPPPPRSM